MITINKPQPWVVYDECNSDFDKEDYQSLREEFPDVKFAVIDEYAVIAFRKATSLPDNHMLQVAVSYCSEEDLFSKKTGKYQALIKLEKGEFVQLPMSGIWDDFGLAYLKTELRNMFTV